MLPQTRDACTSCLADWTDMESRVVECLHCGTTRVARRNNLKHHFDCPECPECGYLGWKPVLELAKPRRTRRRERPRAARRLHSVA
jgi:predicted RNA-binding Zn-ribbon protein involved in translation (DUF1610 family)